MQKLIYLQFFLIINFNTYIIDEESLDAFKSYEELENHEVLVSWLAKLNTGYYMNSKETIYLKYFASQLVKNYTYDICKYPKYGSKKRCRYLNLWIDLETKRYKSQHSATSVESFIEIYIQDLWEKLKNKKSNSCKRDKQNFPYEKMQMRKELYNFCVNRDILKKKDKMYTCKNVNDWITEKI
ncbi:PIR Superfamily Protein [Plasmodium ovale wallikeri]|uniref:PIR Superfamily Protein n=1 Tax=Plasmodium ovale wallikeri TaxID=864142 RepID=A0A1A8YH71_PLAOA|nr:PIR Superfamily Protein [Plasmodium ovale wallikeri]